MRDLFTIVAMLIVVVLCAALAVPYFINWQAYRAEVETALGKAFGVPVHTEGAITVRLLPTPHLALERVAVGRDEPFLSADGLNISLEAPPLLGGNIKVSQARLVRPVMRVDVNTDGAFSVPVLSDIQLGALNAAGINGLIIEDGTLRFVSASEAGIVEQVIGPIDVTASAAALAGPWRIDGSIAGHGLHLATGLPDVERRVRVKLRLDAAKETVNVGAYSEFDGLMQLGAIPVIQGRLIASSPLPEWPVVATADAQAVPARLVATANISNDGWQIIGKDLELSAGEGVRALVLTGDAALDASAFRAGEMPRLMLMLNGRRIDTAPLLQASNTQNRSVVQSLSKRLMTKLDGLPIDLSLTLGSIALSGEEIGPASVKLSVAQREGSPQVDVERFALTFPGGTIQGRGNVLTHGNPRFAGNVQMTGTDTQRLANALTNTGLVPQLTQTLRQWPNMAVAGEIEASEAGIAIRDLHWSAGETSIIGELHYTPAQSKQRGRLIAKLTAHNLDLAALPEFDPILFMQTETDLDVAIEADNLQFGAASAIQDRRLSIGFTTSPEGININQFEMVDHHNAHLVASGHLDENGGRIMASLNAERPEAVLALSRSFMPELWGRVISRLEPDIGPLALEATIARPGTGRPLVAVIKGTAAQTRIDAKLIHDPSGAAKDKAVVEVSLASPNAAAMLRQLGVANAHFDENATVVPIQLKLSARGATFASLDGQGEGMIADSRATLAGQWRSDGSSMRLSGPLTLASSNLTPVVDILQFSLPGVQLGRDTKVTAALSWDNKALKLNDLQGTVGGDAVSGAIVMVDGKLTGELAMDRLDLGDLLALSLGDAAQPQAGQVWSSRRFQDVKSTFEAGVNIDIHLRAKHMRAMSAITLNNASLRLNLSPEIVDLREITGDLPGGGKAKGDIALRRSGSQASFRANVALESMALSALSPGQGDGTLNARLDIGASAESVAGLVANLSGGGEVQVLQAAIPRFDPTALARLMPELLKPEAINTDMSTISTRLGAAFDKGAWPVKDIAIPLTIAGGALRFGPVSLEASQAKASVNGVFDISRLQFDARAHLTSAMPLEGWNGAPPQAIVVWRGPLNAVERTIDAGHAANGLAAISLTRELDRIEKLEADARQRIEKARQERAQREQQRLEQAQEEAARLKAQAAKEAAENQMKAAQQRELIQPQTLPQPPQETPPATPVPIPNAPLDIRPGSLYP